MPTRSAGKGDPSSDNFDLHEYLFYLIAQAMDKYEHGIEEVLKPVGFNKTRWRILMALRDSNGSSVSEISEMTSTRRSTTSRVIERMEEDGLVYRRPNKRDNRITEVYLEKKGIDSLNRIVTVIGKQYRRSVNGIAASDLRLVRKSLQAVIENLQRSSIE